MPAAASCVFRGKRMEYVVFFLAVLLLLVFIFLKGVWDARKNRKLLIQKLYRDYGKEPEREYKPERFERIDSYFRKHPCEDQIDDITWNDLNLDDIFKRMNHTLSSTGEEYLYYTLRTLKKDPEQLEDQERMAEFFDANPDERVKVQLLMMRLGTMGNYSLYNYLDYLDVLGRRSNGRLLLVDAMFVLGAGVCFVSMPMGLLGLAVLLCYNIVTYYKEKSEIDPYLTSLRYVMRLLDVCDRLLKLPLPACDRQKELVQKHKKGLDKMKRGSVWVLSGNSAGTGNPLEIIADYLNMAFHIDILLFNRMISQLRLHLDDVDMLVTQLGQIETAVCIGAYRRSQYNGWCKPVLRSSRSFGENGGVGAELALKNAYHPLLSEPVKNSVRARRGVLLTGSNASGKSTFLKTVALNAIMAQTVNTCTAEAYEGDCFHVYSSMALRDDIAGGESYYIVEIRSLKRILDCIGNEPIICFVDEVLRGTNTVERIAASTQILKSLCRKDVICFAASHDIELTELLKAYYDNYHFEEEIRDGDIIFPYTLLEGKATTRNAIRLLGMMGYDQTIIELALTQAENFVKTGVWRLTDQSPADIL